jgi:hypothetical protein
MDLENSISLDAIKILTRGRKVEKVGWCLKEREVLEVMTALLIISQYCMYIHFFLCIVKFVLTNLKSINWLSNKALYFPTFQLFNSSWNNNRPAVVVFPVRYKPVAVPRREKPLSPGYMCTINNDNRY